ncbi:MAG: ATP-binding protein [Vulcanimicrobiaceae bacterium]
MNVAEPSSDLLGTVDLRIPSKPEWVAVARLAVAAIANRLPFSVEEIEDLKLAIAEACTICIQQTPSSSAIAITCDAATEYLRVHVRDYRQGTRPEAVPAKRPSMLAVEGLGIFLIQALMDVVEYKVDPQSGTELVMTKRVGA